MASTEVFEFEKFVARHGEVAAQAILENVERFNGIRRDVTVSLEERWHLVIAAPVTIYAIAA
jgi:hypothetical protein